MHKVGEGGWDGGGRLCTRIVMKSSVSTAIRIVEKLGATKMFELLGAKRKSHIHPACQEHSYDSSAYWECYIRHNTLSMSQPVGTCKMGAATDASAVVDPQLR